MLTSDPWEGGVGRGRLWEVVRSGVSALMHGADGLIDQAPELLQWGHSEKMPVREAQSGSLPNCEKSIHVA